MSWQLGCLIFSTVLFFGFVIVCVCKFGLLNCYSAYAAKWVELAKHPMLNAWTLVTGLSALLIIPGLLDTAEGSPWQFTAFFCPALLLFVALTPGYQRDKLASKVHVVCASSAAVFSILYILLVQPHLWWLLAAYVVLATIATFIAGKWSWDFWFEIAAYLMIYTAMYILICGALAGSIGNIG